LQLDIPQSLVLADGTTALVKAVAAQVTDGALHQIVYTVEKENGAWAEVSCEELQMEHDNADRACIAPG
jgi:hypothetical protein